MKKRKKVILISGLSILSILLILILAPLTSSYPAPKNFVKEKSFETGDDFFFKTEVTRLPAFLEVTSNQTKIGISVEPDKLQFGVLPKNVSSKKIIDVSNKNDVPVKVKIKKYGNISSFVEINANNFILKPHETKTIILKAGGQKVGKYVGEIQIIIKIPKNQWSQWSLNLI